MVILGYRAGALAKKTFEETVEDNVLGIASQVAYNFFFSLFPLLLFLAPMLSLLGDKRTIVSDLLNRFSEFMPTEAFALFSKVVTDIFFAQNAPGLISIGFVLAVWSGSNIFTTFMDALDAAEAPEETIERVGGVYRVLKPQLLAAYEAHLASTNAVYEPPTCRILSRCIADERRHVAAGESIARHLLRTPALAERGRAGEARLWALLEAAGGVNGSGAAMRVAAPGAETVPPSDDAREFIRLEQAPAQ